jgi:hypothetical protein
MTYKVFVDDNFHHMDEGKRYPAGEFETAEQALAKCHAIVEESLESCRQPGMTPKEVFSNYCAFGDDPWIPGVEFSAWTYAKQLSAEMCD